MAAAKTKKACSICGEEKPLEDFHLRRHFKRDERRAACMACTSQRAKELRGGPRPASEDDLLKRRVRQRTQAAVNAERLTPAPCEGAFEVSCGEENVEAHHPAYDDGDSYLRVLWLCRSCHAKIHAKRDWVRQMELALT